MYHLHCRKVEEDVPVQQSSDGSISISDSILIKVSGQEEQAEKEVLISWSLKDERLSSSLIQLLDNS